MRYIFSIDKRRGGLLQQLKTRLLLSGSLLVFLLFIHISVSTYIISMQNTLNTQSLALHDDSNKLLTTMIDQETGLRGYIATNNKLFLAPFQSGRTSYISTLDHLKLLLSTSNFSHTRSSLSSFERSADDWYQHYALPQFSITQSQTYTQKVQTALQGKQRFDRLRVQASKLQAASQLDIRQQQSWAESLNTLTTILTVLLSLFAILVIWRAFVHLGSLLHQQLKLLENTATSLRSGDLNTRVPTLSSQELDHLGRSFNIMAEALQQQSASVLAQKNREQEQANLALRIQRDELRVLNTALEEANLARSQFLSIMTHELRTPLTAILGFSQIVLRTMEHEKSRNRSNIERVLKNAQHLLHLINDALELIRLENGHMSIAISQVPLSALLSEVIESTRCMSTEKPVTLTTTLDPAIDQIESDPDKLRQILLNLISNAIKFTEEGEIHITTMKQADPESEGEQILISIRDTGIGIAPEIQERIFEAFYQGDSNITRKYGGTGLGLSIVRQFTLLLGGTLVLDSTLGQGSTFTLLLPQRSPISESDPFLPKLQLTTQAHLRYP